MIIYRLTEEQATCDQLKQELEEMRIKCEEENRQKDDALNRSVINNHRTL